MEWRGHFLGFENYDGKIYTMRDFRDVGRTRVKIDTWWFNYKVFVEIPQHERVLKEDTREYKEFEAGDLVRIRTIEDLKEHFAVCQDRILTLPDITSIETLRRIEGKEAVISVTSRNLCKVSFIDGKLQENYILSFEAIEMVEQGYTKKREGERIKVMTDEEIKKDEVIQEMISKVDKTKFKKIIASSFRMKATELKGIDQLLEDWAVAKREIYLILGRNLVVRKPIKYGISESIVKEKLEQLGTKFPQFQVLFRFLHFDDVKNNKLSSSFVQNYNFEFAKTRNESKYILAKTN